jgi:uncharacterized Zn-binding protein involved in type VI secretion
MPPAARLLDSTTHGGLVIARGTGRVLVGGLPAAAVGDQHLCPVPPPAGPHPPAPFPTGSTSVEIGGQPALRVGDIAPCGAAIVTGASNVVFGG